jgi:hypothetical protein
MNEINASRRLKEAAAHKAEAEKIKQVKAAEGEGTCFCLPLKRPLYLSYSHKIDYTLRYL